MKVLVVICPIVLLFLSWKTFADIDYQPNKGSFYQTVVEQINTASSFENQSGPSIFRLDYLSLDKAPYELQAILSDLIPKDRSHIPFSLYISLTNDLNFLGIIGVESDYDDYGYTHGSEFKLIGLLPNGHTLTFNYSSDLYTTPVNGNIVELPNTGKAIDQYFTNENILSLIIDSQSKNKVFFWRAELGWQELVSKYKKNLASADYQQIILHRFINDTLHGDTKTPNNISNGLDDRHGVFLGIYSGLSKSLFEDFHSCQAKVKAQVGARVGQIDKTHLTNELLALILSCQRDQSTRNIQLEVGYEMTQHSQGQQDLSYFDLSSKKKKWRFGLRMDAPSGDLINYVDYNLPNVRNGAIDLLFKIYIEREL